MEKSARLYNCAQCHQLVILCSSCDHGNIYCFEECAQQQRAMSIQQANKRYRESFKGRMNAARRQAAFRQRVRQADNQPPPQKNKVTHHGSSTIPSTDSIDHASEVGCKAENYCHGCGDPVGYFLRSGFLVHSHRTTADLSLKNLAYEEVI